jgi:hypothetical protein
MHRNKSFVLVRPARGQNGLGKTRVVTVAATLSDWRPLAALVVKRSPSFSFASIRVPFALLRG